MPKIRVNNFLGIAPKISGHLLADGFAQIAENVRLWSQGLRPIYGPGTGAALDKTTGDIQTIHRYDSDWLCWTQHVHAVRGPATDDELDKLYFTGTDAPRVTTNALWDAGTPGSSIPPASWLLGIPAPDTAPTVATDGAGNITASATWVYTFVRKYSDGWVEESAPSPPSDVLACSANKVDLTDISDSPMSDPDDYGVTHIRIYRNEGGGEYFFVAEITVATAVYEDDIATVSLGDALETTDYLPPPDGMIGLVRLANACLAGFKNNVVYISEPKRPHAYPLVNQYTMTDNIVGLGVVGNTIVVITDGSPEIGRGVDPSAYSFKRHPGNYPCVSARSIAFGDIGVLWATPRGMAISDGVSVTNGTAEFMTKEEWDDFSPETIHGVVHDGRYYGWFDNDTDADGTKIGGGFILDKTERAFLTTLGEYVYAAHAIQDEDTLYFAAKEPTAALDNYVYAWEVNPSAPLAYDWKSKIYITPGRTNFAFAQIIADFGEGLTQEEIDAIEAEIAAVQAANDALTALNGAVNDLAINEVVLNGDTLTQTAPDADYVPGLVTFQYWADGVLKFTTSIGSDEPFPMPSGFEAYQHEFQISGALKVDEVKLATSMEELNS